MILGRFKYLVGLLSLAAVHSAYPAYAASDKAPECACLVPMSRAAAPVGSLNGVSGNVMVTQAAGFAVASEGAQLSPGSRVIVGADSAATLQAGPNCMLPLAQNSTATLLAQDQQICVQVTTPQLRQATLTSPEKIYGADMPVDLPVVEEPVPVRGALFGVPEQIFGVAAGAAVLCAIFCDDDDDRRPKPISPDS